MRLIRKIGCGPASATESEKGGKMSTIPRRIQRRRTKGWTMPPGAIYVGRPTKWGNPFVVGEMQPWPHRRDLGDGRVETAEQAVALFRQELIRQLRGDNPGADHSLDMVLQLRGHDLACWCKLCDTHRDGLPLGVKCHDCQPCHADVLLEIANG